MNVRDRYILGAVALIGLLGAFWLLALSPKRAKSAKLDKDIATAEQALQQAKQEKIQFARAQVQFPGLYAALGRLGKAVPADEDVPSLLVQLGHAANIAAINFHSIELKVDKDGAAAPPASAAAAASATAPPATASAGGAGTAAAPTGAASASASTGAAASAPSAAGAAGAPAGGGTIQPLPFEYKFKGGFFSLRQMIREMQDLIVTKNRELAVSGRLLTIEGFSLKRGGVTILANSYLLPAGQPLFAGATPQGPAGIAPTEPQPASAPATTTTPPSAAVTAP